jgi:hypothetical protein
MLDRFELKCSWPYIEVENHGLQIHSQLSFVGGHFYKEAIF